jgi:hypothetical protein
MMKVALMDNGQVRPWILTQLDCSWATFSRRWWQSQPSTMSSWSSNSAPSRTQVRAFRFFASNLPSGSWWFGPTYRNPFWVNDIASAGVGHFQGSQATGVVPVWCVTNSGQNTFIMAIFTAEDFDDTCNGPAADNIYDGVAYNFGTLSSGCWYSLICLDGTGLFHQMPTDGSGAYIAVYLSSLDPVTLYPEACQPLLWGTKPNNPSQQGPIQWDDDNPTDGQID